MAIETDDAQESDTGRSRILVAVPLDAGEGARLLSWAVGPAARRRDTVVALHVLEEGERAQLRRAKAFVIALLAEFTDSCQAKELTMQAKVIAGGAAAAVGSTLIEEARRSNAGVLVIGRSRSSSKVANYCFSNAPQGCSVITAPAAADSKSSPRTVLDCRRPADCSSPSSNDTGRCRRTGLWQRLSHAMAQLPFLRSSGNAAPADACSTPTDGAKPQWKCFSYEEVAAATKNFHPDAMVGRGGYSEVYHGVLCGGESVAVKRLTMRSKANDKKEQEFLAELGILGHVRHPNAAHLLGCCAENGLYLIFEFCANGALSTALHGKNGRTLDWQSRYKIAVGVARGLHYLHRCCRRRIIHRDIKAANILLGDDLEPQISDFGLAKWLPKQWTDHSALPIEGTFGYLAPEYFSHGIVSEKTDMFALGVLLLEIVSGRKPVDCGKQSLLQWAKPHLEAGRAGELVDPRLGMNYQQDQLARVVRIASDCIRKTPTRRPSIGEVFYRLTADTTAAGSEVGETES